MTPILSFYLYPHWQNAKGFKFNDIFTWDDDTLEQKHDYIQWFFPLTVPSAMHPDSPYIKIEDGDLTTLVKSKWANRMRKLQRKAFKRMLKFYKFNHSWLFGIRPEEKWSEDYPLWVAPGAMDHNYLRITRIITSLVLFGNRDLAHEFLQALLDADEEYRNNTGYPCILEDVKNFWIEAYENTDPHALLENHEIEKRLEPQV
jgi:hypothetical protein